MTDSGFSRRTPLSLRSASGFVTPPQVEVRGWRQDGAAVLLCCSAVVKVGGWRSGGKSVSELNHRSPLAENGEGKISTVRGRDVPSNPSEGDPFGGRGNVSSQP